MSISPNQRKIQKMTRLWYEYVNFDHHKDRDCHWIIEVSYSYGGHPVYQARHFGYIAKNYESAAHETLAGAEKALLSFLVDAFDRAIHQARKVLSEPDEYYMSSKEQAVFAIEEMLPEVENVR